MAPQNELKSKQKKKLFEEWMDDDHILLQLDARRDDVIVPENLKDNPALTLKLSHRFQGTTSCDDEKITTYLRFSGNYQECIIPWGAIWNITSSDGPNQMWPEDLPKEVVIQLAKSKLAELGKKILGKQDKDSPALAEALPRTEATEAEPKEDDPKKANGDSKRKSGSHLKRIK